KARARSSSANARTSRATQVWPCSATRSCTAGSRSRRSTEGRSLGLALSLAVAFGSLMCFLRVGDSFVENGSYPRTRREQRSPNQDTRGTGSAGPQGALPVKAPKARHGGWVL